MSLYNTLPQSNFGFQYPGTQNSLQERMFDIQKPYNFGLQYPRYSSLGVLNSIAVENGGTLGTTSTTLDLLENLSSKPTLVGQTPTIGKKKKSQFGSTPLKIGDHSDLITGAGNMIGSAIETGADEKHSYDQQQNAVRDAQIELAGKIPVVGGIVQAGLSVANAFDKGLQRLGLAPTNVNMQSAKRAGVGGSATFNKAINNVIGSGVLGFAMGKVAKADDATDMTQQYANSFGKSMNDYTAAQDLSEARMFNASKASKFVNNWNTQNQMITGIGMQSELAKNNSADQLYNIQNQNKYAGNSPKLLNSKKGSKFPELDEVRNLVKSWSPKYTETTEPQKFQLGGKMNLLPSGALHARKHNLSEIEPELDGQITNKGIPVITKSKDGICQTAEIEKEEWVLRKEFTDELEALYKLYQKDKLDEAAIKAGKLICQELLMNTDDQANLIKNVK